MFKKISTYFILSCALIFISLQSQASLTCKDLFYGQTAKVIDLSKEESPSHSFFQNYFNPEKEILIVFDRLSHPFLISQDHVFNGRLVTRPIRIERKSVSEITATFAIKITNLSREQISKFTDFLLQQNGKKSFTCVNAIQAVLAQGLGLKIGDNKTLYYIEELIENIMSVGILNSSGELATVEGYQLSESTLDDVIDRGQLLRQQLSFSFPVLNKVYQHRNQNNDQLIFRGDDAREFVLTKEDEVEQSPTPPPQLSSWQKRRMGTAYATKRVWNFLHSTVHNMGQAWKVFSRLDETTKLIDSLPKMMQPVFRTLFKTFAKPMGFGLINPEHPWVTGIDPYTQKEIWPQNILFSSPASHEWQNKKHPENDDVIVSRVGKFLVAMARRSAEKDIEQGPLRRMPHVVNYLHGAVGYNGVFIIFNNFHEATTHFTDPKFIKEIKRFVKNEKREIMVVFRDRDYNEDEYAYFLGVVRSSLPWYANANGPKKKVLWGSVSPYATINIINGNYFKHIQALEEGNTPLVVMPGLQNKSYFQNTYNGFKDSPGYVEKLFAWINYMNIQRRGFQSNMAFTPREQIEPKRKLEYDEALASGKPMEMIAPIPKPKRNQ